MPLSSYPPPPRSNLCYDFFYHSFAGSWTSYKCIHTVCTFMSAFFFLSTVSWDSSLWLYINCSFLFIPRWYSTVWISTFYLPILLFMDTWVVSSLGVFWTKLPWTFYRVCLILSPMYFMWKSSCHQCWEKDGKIMVAVPNMEPACTPASAFSRQPHWVLISLPLQRGSTWKMRVQANWGALKHAFSVSQSLKETVECCCHCCCIPCLLSAPHPSTNWL